MKRRQASGCCMTKYDVMSVDERDSIEIKRSQEHFGERGGGQHWIDCERVFSDSSKKI